MVPDLRNRFETAFSQAVISAEKRVCNLNPSTWLRQMAPERWTPQEKLKVDANVHTKQEIDEEAILVAAKTIERRKQETESHGGD
jgi:hypothetical protein